MSLQIFACIQCTNTDKHKDHVWRKMDVGQLEPERRVTFSCPECRSSIAVDLTWMKSYILTGYDLEKDG